MSYVGTCSDDVLCSMEGAISGNIEPVQWWYQYIDDIDNMYKGKMSIVPST